MHKRPELAARDRIGAILERNSPKGRIALHWQCVAELRAIEPEIVDSANRDFTRTEVRRWWRRQLIEYMRTIKRAETATTSQGQQGLLNVADNIGNYLARLADPDRLMELRARNYRKRGSDGQKAHYEPLQNEVIQTMERFYLAHKNVSAAAKSAFEESVGESIAANRQTWYRRRRKKLLGSL